jgi:hypothetical protein
LSSSSSCHSSACSRLYTSLTVVPAQFYYKSCSCVALRFSPCVLALCCAGLIHLEPGTSLLVVVVVILSALDVVERAAQKQVNRISFAVASLLRLWWRSFFVRSSRRWRLARRLCAPTFIAEVDKQARKAKQTARKAKVRQAPWGSG